MVLGDINESGKELQNFSPLQKQRHHGQKLFQATFSGLWILVKGNPGSIYARITVKFW